MHPTHGASAGGYRGFSTRVVNLLFWGRSGERSRPKMCEQSAHAHFFEVRKLGNPLRDGARRDRKLAEKQG